MVGGLCVGLIGFFVPAVLGVGYDQVDRVLSGDLFFTCGRVARGSQDHRDRGVLCVGQRRRNLRAEHVHRRDDGRARLGTSRTSSFPQGTAGPGAYALVGMGTAFAGIIRTPLTSVIMIFEVTRNYTIIVPLMISNLIAFYISQQLQREPIYEALARQDGLHLPTRSISTACAPAAGAVARFKRHHSHSRSTSPSPRRSVASRHRRSGRGPSSDDRGLAGMIRSSDIDAAVAHGRGSATVRDLLDAVDPDASDDEAVPHVHSDHPLGLALTRMGAMRHTVLPVVSRANVRTMIGVVTLPDILEAYGVAQVSDVPPRAMVAMSEASPHPTSTSHTASTPVFVATFGGILVAIALLLALDLFLARVDHRESRRPRGLGICCGPRASRVGTCRRRRQSVSARPLRSIAAM